MREVVRNRSEPEETPRSSPRERRVFGIWIAVLVILLFTVPVILKWAGLLPARN